MHLTAETRIQPDGEAATVIIEGHRQRHGAGRVIDHLSCVHVERMALSHSLLRALPEPRMDRSIGRWGGYAELLIIILVTGRGMSVDKQKQGAVETRKDTTASSRHVRSARQKDPDGNDYNYTGNMTPAVR